MRRIIMVGMFVTLVAGCNRPVVAPAANAGQPEGRAGPVEVKTVKPERLTIRRTVEQPGHIEAFEQAPLHVKIAGFVRKVHVDIGDRIKKDALLAELWVPEMEEELKQKQGTVAMAKAEIDQAQAALAAAAANIKSAQAKVAEAQAGRARAVAEANRWQAQFTREQVSVKKGTIDQQTLDETRFQLESARAAADEVEAKVNSAQAAADESRARKDKAVADVRVVEARLQIAEADQRRMEALLQYARITAPFDGVVTRRNVDTGHFLQPAGGGKTEPVFVVARMDPVRVFVDVPEADALLIRNGAGAKVRIQALKGQEFAGKVARSAGALDARTRTLRTEIDLANPDSKLLSGMYAYAAIIVEFPNVLTLPAAAVVVQGEQAYFFLVEDGKAVRTPIRIGARDAQAVEVLKKQKRKLGPGEGVWEDFTGSERVIGGNLAGLGDGQAVRVAD